MSNKSTKKIVEIFLVILAVLTALVLFACSVFIGQTLFDNFGLGGCLGGLLFIFGLPAVTTNGKS